MLLAQTFHTVLSCLFLATSTGIVTASPLPQQSVPEYLIAFNTSFKDCFVHFENAINGDYAAAQVFQTIWRQTRQDVDNIYPKMTGPTGIPDLWIRGGWQSLEYAGVFKSALSFITPAEPSLAEPQSVATIILPSGVAKLNIVTGSRYYPPNPYKQTPVPFGITQKPGFNALTSADYAYVLTRSLGAAMGPNRDRTKPPEIILYTKANVRFRLVLNCPLQGCG